MDSSSCQEYFERNGHRWLQIHIKSSKWCGICEKLIEGKTKSEQNSFQCLFCKLISHHQCWSDTTTPCSKSPTASTSTIPPSTNSRSSSSYSFFALRSRSFESTSSSNPSSPTSSAVATVAVSSSASTSTSSGGVAPLVSVTTSTKHPTKKEKESNKSRKEKLKRINQYEILSELGRGACGKVYLVEDVDTRDPSKKKYAMKTFPPIKFQQRNLSRGQKNSSTTSSSQETLIRREIAILRRLIHPNVIYLKDVIEEQVSKGFHLYLILEYVDGGILLKSKINEDDPSSSPQFLAPNRPNGFYSEEETSRFFSQILSGLEYLHFNSIAHRDLKPDNILLTSSGVIKLTDFGGSTDFSSGATHSTRNGYVYDTQGTWAFWAPEICRSEDESKYSAFLGDVWAAGIVLFVMLYGILPFWSDDTNQLFELIENRYLHPEIKLFIPEERREFRSIRAQEMVESVLIGDPLHRPSITTCQSHPWCQSFVTNESRCDYRTQLLRNSSYQKSVLDLTDEDLSLDHAITPGKAVYISKLLFRKIIKKSNESLQKIAAVISSMDEEDHESHEDENDYNDKDKDKDKEREEREEGGQDDDEKKSKFPKKKNSLRELWRAISLQSPASSERDLIVSDNPLKSNKSEDSNEEGQGQGQGQGDEKNPSERSRNNQNIENDNDSASIMSSSTDEDDDEEEEAHSTWTWDIFDTSQEFLRRFTDSSSSPSPSSSSALQLSLPPPPTLPPSPTASSSSNSSMTSLDLLSFQRNLHQWCYLKTLLPTSCSFCKRLVWKTTIGLGGGENIFQCKLCHKIFHQSCCYEEEECCEEGSKGG